MKGIQTSTMARGCQTAQDGRVGSPHGLSKHRPMKFLESNLNQSPGIPKMESAIRSAFLLLLLVVAEVIHGTEGRSRSCPPNPNKLFKRSRNVQEVCQSASLVYVTICTYAKNRTLSALRAKLSPRNKVSAKLARHVLRAMVRSLSKP